jgi:hypothetical protein
MQVSLATRYRHAVEADAVQTKKVDVPFGGPCFEGHSPRGPRHDGQWSTRRPADAAPAAKAPDLHVPTAECGMLPASVFRGLRSACQPIGSWQIERRVYIIIYPRVAVGVGPR